MLGLEMTKNPPIFQKEVFEFITLWELWRDCEK
jgi:hypothetical protein